MFYLSLLASLSAILLLYVTIRSSKDTYRKNKTLINYYFGYFIFFFIITTFLHYYIDYYIDIPIVDTTNALVNFNIINSIGLLITCIGYILSKRLIGSSNIKFEINYKKIKNKSIFFITIGFLLFTYLFFFQIGSIVKSSENIDEGKSIYLYMFIENLPLLMGWAYISHYFQKKLKPSNISFFIMLFLIVLVSIIISGTRGSRVSILIQISTFLILYSSIFKKIKFRNILLVVLFGFVFNNFFSIYKYGGIEAFSEYISTGYKPDYISNYQDNKKVILHDLGRSDVQAFIYDRIIEKDYTPSYFPHSYLYALNNIIPDKLQPNIELYSKESLGYSAQYLQPLNENFKSTRIYGVNGESVLNFGFIGLIASFLIFGIVIQRVIYINQRAESYGITLFLPFIVLVPIYYLFYDFGNILFMLIKTWAIPFLIFITSSNLKYRLNDNK